MNPKDTQDSGGAAFPQPDACKNEFNEKYGTDRGMTLRDYFAGQALAGYFAGVQQCGGIGSYENAATIAYKQADAMLAARKGIK